MIKTYCITVIFKADDKSESVEEMKSAILSGEFQRELSSPSNGDTITNLTATFKEIK